MGGDAPGVTRAVTCRPEALDARPPGPFRPLAVPRRVVVVKRKHGERVDRWRWDGDLVGTGDDDPGVPDAGVDGGAGAGGVDGHEVDGQGERPALPPLAVRREQHGAGVGAARYR